MLKPTAAVELVWQDETGSTSATTVWASSSSTYDEIDASATALASILASLTGAVLVKQRIKYISVPDEPVIASGGASIKDTGSFFFSVGEDQAIALIVVHAIKDSIILDTGTGAGIVIDDSNIDVIAFIDAVIGSVVANPFGGDVNGFITAYKQSRI